MTVTAPSPWRRCRRNLSPSRCSFVLAGLLLGLAGVGTSPGWAQEGLRTLRSPDRPTRAPANAPTACEGGVSRDDGTLETGYGWVPTVTDGEVIQRFERGNWQTGVLESVCVCFLRTGSSDTIQFDVVLYGDQGSYPHFEPYASFPATGTGIPEGLVGKFIEVEIPKIPLLGELSYVGVRWDAATNDSFFLCADHSETTPPSPVYFRERRFRFWGNALTTQDPTFDGHRAAMVRFTTATGLYPVPLQPRATLTLSLLMAATGVWLLRR